MAPKRKEITSFPSRQVKKAKKDPLAEKLQRQLLDVTAALNQAAITEEVHRMLEIVLPLSLGVFADHRHHFQQQLVEGVAEIVDELETALKKQVADKRSGREAAAAEKPLRDKEVADAADKLNTKIAEVHGLKVALAGKAVAFREAQSSLAQAEEAKVVDGLKARQAEKKKEDFLAAVEKLVTLKTAVPEDAETRKINSDLMASLKKYKFEESMMIALPAAFAKAPDSRGQFDVMAISQLQGELDKLIAEQDTILVAAAPGQAQCEMTIKECQARLSAVRGEQNLAAKAFDVASKGQAECEAASVAAQKVLRESVQLSRSLDRLLNNAEVEVELFEQGPRETFKELRERTMPPPVAEVQVEEEDVQEADSMSRVGAAHLDIIDMVIA